MFKAHDSDQGRAGRVPHTAFDDPTCPAGRAAAGERRDARAWRCSHDRCAGDQGAARDPDRHRPPGRDCTAPGRSAGPGSDRVPSPTSSCWSSRSTTRRTSRRPASTRPQRCSVRRCAKRIEVSWWTDTHREIHEEPVIEPLFLTGLPRSGTTYFQYLFDQRSGHADAAHLGGRPALSAAGGRPGRGSEPPGRGRRAGPPDGG